VGCLGWVQCAPPFSFPVTSEMVVTWLMSADWNTSICIITLIRIKITTENHGSNAQQIYSLIALFTCLEALLGVINACLPVLKPSSRYSPTPLRRHGYQASCQAPSPSSCAPRRWVRHTNRKTQAGRARGRVNGSRWRKLPFQPARKCPTGLATHLPHAPRCPPLRRATSRIKPQA
jgi:hypothetical protein